MMIQTHLFLNISNWQEISNEVHNYFVSMYNTADSLFYICDMDVNHTLDHCAKLKRFFTINKLHPLTMWMVVFDPKEPVPLHCDSDGKAPLIRMLWPIQNCQESKTSFWSVPKDSGVSIKANNNGILTLWPNDIDIVKINEYELTQPLVLDTSIPHTVEFYNQTTVSEPRLSFNVGFDLTFPISMSIDVWRRFALKN